MAIRIAFTGTGYISKIHAQAAQTAGAELVAIVNHKTESMTEFANQFGIIRQYTAIEAMLADGNIDAVVISTPNYLHAPQAIAALQAGIHVMVEKPMALNAQEAREMIQASQSSGALLMVAHCWRFDPEVLWLKNHTTQLGPIIRTKGYGVHVHWGPSGWFTQARYAGGGAMADMGIHAVDTARFLLGDPLPTSVYARIGTYYKDFDVDDTGILLVNWDNGATSVIESGWWQPHSDGPEAATQLYGKNGFGSLFPTFLKLPSPSKNTFETIDSGYPAVRTPHCPQSMYDNQLQYFLQCIDSGETPIPGGEEGLINMKIVDAAYESARTGKVVDIL